jgi:hypothetical protein
MPTLQELKDKYNVKQVWSWSRYKLYKEDKYSYFLRYILKTLPDMPSGRYSELGSACHKILEDLYNGLIKYSEMPKLFHDAVLDADIKQLKYDRGDPEKNVKIKRKYEASIDLFFKNHNKIPYKVKSEAYILTLIYGYLFQGYVDASHNEDGNLVITDWKTSTIYKGEKLEKEKGQLLIYAIAFSNHGVPVDKIRLRWNFMKYVDVDTELINGSKKTRTILRCELGKSLNSNAKSWLNKLGYKDEAEDYLDQLFESNDIHCLPKEVQDKYKVRDCYVYVECDEKMLQDFQRSIAGTLDEANEKIIAYENTMDEDIWWEEVTADKSYFLANLSDYSAKIHKPYKKYLESLQEEKNSNALLDRKEDWIQKLFEE